MDDSLKSTLQKIPLLTVKAGPRDGEQWIKRLKEEYKALIEFMRMNKETDNDWFRLEANSTGTRWTGKCWYVFEGARIYAHEQIPVTYPATPFEILIPELEGLTSKMYRCSGGSICLTVHFKPLWARNVPHFGIAHALAMGLQPWLAAEVPDLVEKGLISPDSACSTTE